MRAARDRLALTCFNALGGDDTDRFDNRVSRSAPSVLATGLGRAARLEDPDGVAEEPALPGSLQHAAAAADFGQRPVTPRADGQHLPLP